MPKTALLSYQKKMCPNYKKMAKTITQLGWRSYSFLMTKAIQSTARKQI